MAKPKVELNYLIACDNAFADNAGKVNIIGIFETIFAENVPALHSKLFVVSSIKGKKGKYAKRIEIKHPTEDKIIAISEKDIEIKNDNNNANLINEFSNIIFPIEGNYEISFFVDNTLLKKDLLKVVKMKKNG